jgi:hypothetical protein
LTQAAEAEKNSLETAKLEAQALLAAERDVIRHKWTLYQVCTGD